MSLVNKKAQRGGKEEIYYMTKEEKEPQFRLSGEPNASEIKTGELKGELVEE